MRVGGRGGRSWVLAVLLAVAGLVVGTWLGQDARGALGPFNRAIEWGPESLNLAVVSVTVWVRTNLAGVVLGACGLWLGLRRV